MENHYHEIENNYVGKQEKKANTCIIFNFFTVLFTNPPPSNYLISSK